MACLEVDVRMKTGNARSGRHGCGPSELIYTTTLEKRVDMELEAWATITRLEDVYRISEVRKNV